MFFLLPVQAPNIIIPEELSDENSPRLVLVLGKLSITSDISDAAAIRSAGQLTPAVHPPACGPLESICLLCVSLHNSHFSVIAFPPMPTPVFVRKLNCARGYAHDPL